MGEERGDEDGVEGLPALEAGRVGVRDEAVDAELLLQIRSGGTSRTAKRVTRP
jgi:hypothetical protein